MKKNKLKKYFIGLFKSVGNTWRAIISFDRELEALRKAVEDLIGLRTKDIAKRIEMRKGIQTLNAQMSGLERQINEQKEEIKLLELKRGLMLEYIGILEQEQKKVTPILVNNGYHPDNKTFERAKELHNLINIYELNK